MGEIKIDNGTINYNSNTNFGQLGLLGEPSGGQNGFLAGLGFFSGSESVGFFSKCLV